MIPDISVTAARSPAHRYGYDQRHDEKLAGWRGNIIPPTDLKLNFGRIPFYFDGSSTRSVRDYVMRIPTRCTLSSVRKADPFQPALPHSYHVLWLKVRVLDSEVVDRSRNRRSLSHKGKQHSLRKDSESRLSVSPSDVNFSVLRLGNDGPSSVRCCMSIV